MKMRVAVEFELGMKMNKLIEGCVDYAMEDFCRTLIEQANNWLDEEEGDISLKYLDYRATEGSPILSDNNSE